MNTPKHSVEMHLTDEDLNSILGNCNSNKKFVIIRLLLSGLWQYETILVRIEDFAFKNRILLVRGNRHRRIVLDPTTAQLIKSVCNKKRKGRIIGVTDARLSVILSEIFDKSNITAKTPATTLRNTFIQFSIVKGRNAASVYAQAGQPMKDMPIPSIEDRKKDFDSKPII